MDKWLVTGAGGFLGANAGLWLKNKVKTVGQTRSHRGLKSYGAEVSLDLRDYKATEKMIKDVAPNVILHAAAVSGHETCANDPIQANEVNVRASSVLSEAAAEIGARFIYVSTDALFSGENGNYSETDPTQPFSLYGETKLLGENKVLASGASAFCVRTNFFGWSAQADRSVLEFFVNSMRFGRPIQGYPDFVVTSIYVQSLLRSIWELNEIGYEGIVNVAAADAVSKYDFGLAIATEFGLDGRLIAPAPSTSGGLRTSRSRDLSLDTGLLATLLGQKVQTQAEGIAEARVDEATLADELRGELDES
jgi:dTDP-4-dehydrorhamnose reductase